MNVLVTGGCGYLGSIVVRRLLSEGHDVTVLDNMLYGNSLQCEVIRGDVTENASISRALQGRDAVIHLAAIVGEGACNLNKEYTVRVNYLATRNLSKLCEEHKTKLIFPSTASVYGARPDSLLDEHSQTVPTSVYAITKLAAEDAIRTNSQNYVILRLGTLFGLSGRMRFDLVVNRFAAIAAARETIVVFGGSQFRPFIHLDDVADSLALLLENDKTGLFNLGGYNYRISDVAKLVAERNNGKIHAFEELRDPRDYRLNSDLAIKTLNATFKKTVENSLDSIVEYSRRLNYKDPIYNNEEWLRSTGHVS
jgi:nucleoside-diphosphate-sugar epimerase